MYFQQKQYFGKKIIFPEKSFLISGISFYQENCSNIKYDTELTMKHDPDNKYDTFAISIMHDDKIVGYVPNTNTNTNTKTNIKEICKTHITEPLRVMNIKQINGIYGIRVIPKCFYEYDPNLESQILFADE